MAKDSQYHGRAKHIDFKFHYIREQVARKCIELQYFESKDMIKDTLTKGLTSAGSSGNNNLTTNEEEC